MTNPKKFFHMKKLSSSKVIVILSFVFMFGLMTAHFINEQKLPTNDVVTTSSNTDSVIHLVTGEPPLLISSGDTYYDKSTSRTEVRITEASFLFTLLSGVPCRVDFNASQIDSMLLDVSLSNSSLLEVDVVVSPQTGHSTIQAFRVVDVDNADDADSNTFQHL